jgi:putative ABC transport system ATP-binding protein
MTSTEHIISIQDVSRTYRQGLLEVQALKGINLDIERGSFIALAGSSGSGKTTLLNQVGCLDKPDKGTVVLDGEDVSLFSKRQAAIFRLNHIGFIFQAYNLIPVMTAFENAEFVMMLKGIKKEVRREKVDLLLSRVGLSEMSNRRPHELSGGQQQRVAVVRAIVSEPAIILADEPTANLDSKSSIELLDLMRELNREHGLTFVFSSHDPLVIERADRVVQLDSGRIIDDEKRGAVA